MIASWIASFFFFFSSRRRHTRSDRDWSSDVCSSDLGGRHVAILLSIWRAQRAFLPLPAVLLLFLEPRKQSRRRTERPELEDDLAMFLVLRDEEYPLALRNNIDGLLKRNLVVAFPFLAAR